MPAALRPFVPCVTAGVALVGAGVISVTPIQPTFGSERAITRDYHLTASTAVTCAPGSTSVVCDDTGSAATPAGPAAPTAGGPSLLYVPVNLLNMALSVPAWEIQAMNRFADAMIGTGSWQVWGPTNVFGFDEWDPPKLKGLIDMLVPVKPFSSELGDQLSWWARANLPMNAGCAAMPGACPDLSALLDVMFKVPLSELYEGYTFPTVTNPFTGEETSWSGAHVKLKAFGPFTSMWDYLTSPPTGPETVPLRDYFTVPLKLGKALFDSFYPFVQNSEWFNDQQTGLAPLFRALAPLLCPLCTPGKPVYDNPWLYHNYPPKQQSITEATDGADALQVTATASESTTDPSPVGEQMSATSDPMPDAVAGLLKKFEFAKATEGPTGEAATETAEQVAEKPAETVEPAADPEEPKGAGSAQHAQTPESSGAHDESGDSDAAPEESDDGGKRGDAGISGKHRKSGDEDTGSVKSVRDETDSATTATGSVQDAKAASSAGASSGDSSAGE